MSIFDQEVVTVGSLISVVAIWVATQAVIVLAIQWLWNGVMPELFGGPTLDFLQAAALYFLVRLVISPLRVKLDIDQ